MVLIEFFNYFKYIYPKELELKIEHQGTHATSHVNFDISIEDIMFIYKLNEERNKFPFVKVRTTYLSCDISSSIF